MGALKLILELGAIATAAGALVALIIGVYKVGVWFAHFCDDLFGQDERPGRKAQPGILERTANTEAKVADIGDKVEALDRGQVHIIERFTAVETKLLALEPDHGGSLYDMVKRLDDRFNGEVKS